MSINGVTSAAQAYESTKVKTNTKSKDTANTSSSTAATGNVSSADQETPSAVYEKSSDTPKEKVYKQDTATIAKLKADAERRTQQLRNLVEKLFTNQGQTFDEANMYQLLREGKVPVDAETAKQAQADIAEDGYWGITQTSDRIVSFAKALTGGDPAKADEMIDAVKKGFEEAKKAWGGELPEICQQTLDSALQKLDEWKSSLASETEAQ